MMEHQTSLSSKGENITGYRVWHFMLAVFVMAVTMQLLLGSLTPLPKQEIPIAPRFVSAFHFKNHHLHRKRDSAQLEAPPLSLRGEMTTGPLLAKVIKQYIPESTTEQATNLSNTLPPCDDPRMIVIMPESQDRVF